jgi:hypothetical protein
MAIVKISPALFEEIKQRFKGRANDIIDLLETLEENPKKGSPVGHVGNIAIRELKQGVYRFYFITDGHKIRVLKSEELKDLLIKFVRISDKDTQQKTIDEIKTVLRNLGAGGFK